MLARIVSKRLSLLFKNRAYFGSSHDHHDYHVNVNRNQPWVKYVSNPRLVSIDGVQETNYTLQPPLNDDPFEHIRDKPFFSFERLVFNEPWFHEDSHEPYNSAPDRGYISGSDPLESRLNYSVPVYITCSVLTLVLSLYGIGDRDYKNAQATQYERFVASKYVDETLEAKNKKLNELKARENELLKSLSGPKKAVEQEQE